MRNDAMKVAFVEAAMRTSNESAKSRVARGIKAHTRRMKAAAKRRAAQKAKQDA